MMRRLLLSVLFLLAFRPALAGEVYTDLPDEIDAAGNYVFYAHGLIVEGDDPEPVHPQFGKYDFPAVREALAGGNVTLIAEQRPRGANPVAYAEKLAGQAARLIEAGVAPENITLIGFSRGGYIVAYASHLLEASPVNTVILAGCADWVGKKPGLKLNGHVLSVYETSDFVGSCEELAARSDRMLSYQEVALSTGKSHGTFYQPLPEWVEPVRNWISAR